MSGKIAYVVSLSLAIVSFVLLVADIVLIDSNRDLQKNANQRQEEINKIASLSSVNQGLVQALAEVAVNENDGSVKDLLAAQGITLNQHPAAAKK